MVLNHAAELVKRGHAVDCWFLEDVLERPARPKRFEAIVFCHRFIEADPQGSGEI